MNVNSNNGTGIVSNLKNDVMLALLFASLTAVCSKISIHLWFTPVPITLQVFAVILSGLVLGSRLGALSQLMYLSLGFSGVPVFAGWTAGPAYVLGPTGGYLVGFIFAALLSGFISERITKRSKLMLLMSGLISIAVIYAFGTSWLAIWMKASGDGNLVQCIKGAWIAGAAPFIILDLIKAAIASTAVSRTGLGISLIRQRKA